MRIFALVLLILNVSLFFKGFGGFLQIFPSTLPPRFIRRVNLPKPSRQELLQRLRAKIKEMENRRSGRAEAAKRKERKEKRRDERVHVQEHAGGKEANKEHKPIKFGGVYWTLLPYVFPPYYVAMCSINFF